MKTYIQLRYNGNLETIDEFDTRKEAKEMLTEYQMVYEGTGGQVYLSTRACKDWKAAIT